VHTCSTFDLPRNTALVALKISYTSTYVACRPLCAPQVIIGGGICGLLAARGCTERKMPYVLVEKNAVLGGVWQTLANEYSHLQVRPYEGEILDADQEL
jgi:cation diffusion facilitator CzcD-associated flavoprotein CzcO